MQEEKQTKMEEERKKWAFTQILARKAFGSTATPIMIIFNVNANANDNAYADDDANANADADADERMPWQ